MASVRQMASQVKKHGARNASWLCFWRDLDGRQRSKAFGATARGKRSAENYAKQIEAELTLRIDVPSSVTWKTFRKEFEASRYDLTTETQRNTAVALGHLERISRPKRLHEITAKTLEDYAAQRSREGIRASSIGHELKLFKAALNTAKRWRYIQDVPQARRPKVESKVPSFISGTEFGMLYAACDQATVPKQITSDAGDYWRALLSWLYLTGWRISATLAVRWDQIEDGVVHSLAEQTKSRREVLLTLHPMIVERLKALKGNGADGPFEPRLKSVRLRHHFVALQESAGIEPRFKNEGQWYGFHDLRRGFATNNYQTLSALELTQVMQHRDLSTTKRYINMAEEHTAAETAAKIFVPDVLRE